MPPSSVAPFPVGGFFTPAADSSALEPQPLPTEGEPFEPCDRGTPTVFSEDAVTSLRVAAVGQEVYAWIAADEARGATGDAFPLGDSTAWRDVLNEAAPVATAEARTRFAATFAGAGRAAWPNPWATRLLTDEDAPRLLRVKLSSNARWLVIEGQSSVVMDVSGNRLEDDVAVAGADAIVGVFLGAPQVIEGQCGAAYPRSMVITNPKVIDEWSIGGVSEVERVASDVYKVELLMQLLRPCGFEVDFEAWADVTGCANYAGADDEVGSYERGLAWATAAYSPGVQQLANLANTLNRDSRNWNADPLFVQSERPSGPGSSAADGGALDAGLASIDASIDASATQTADASDPSDAAATSEASARREAGMTEVADGGLQ